MTAPTAAELREIPASQRYRIFRELSPEQQEAITVPCDGAAHSNAHIDNCGLCVNYTWGRMLPRGTHPAWGPK